MQDLAVAPAPATIATRSSSALGWSFAGALGKAAGQLIIQIILARLLGPRAFGQYAVLIGVLALGNLFADCGFGSVLIQKKDLDDDDVRMALGWTMLLSMVAAAALCLLAPWLASQFRDPELASMFRIGAIAIVLNAGSGVSSSLLRRELRQKSLQIIQLCAYTFGFGAVAILLALRGWNGWSLIIGFVVQGCVMLIATYLMCPHTLRPRWSGDPGLIRFGVATMGSELSNWCVESLDRLAIGNFWGILPVGYYSVAFNLSKAPVSVLTFNVQNIAFAGVSRLQHHPESLRRGFVVMQSAALLATLPIFALVSYEAHTVLFLMYGQKWLDAAPYMTALALAVPASVMGRLTGAVLRGTGAVRVELTAVCGAGVVLFLGLLLLRHTPLALAVWVVPFAYLMRWGLLAAAVRRRLDIPLRDVMTPLTGALALTASGLVAAAACRLVVDNGNEWLSVIPLAAGLSAIGLLLMARMRWFAAPPLLAAVRQWCDSRYLGTLALWMTRA